MHAAGHIAIVATLSQHKVLGSCTRGTTPWRTTDCTQATRLRASECRHELQSRAHSFYHTAVSLQHDPFKMPCQRSCIQTTLSTLQHVHQPALPSHTHRTLTRLVHPPKTLATPESICTTYPSMAVFLQRARTVPAAGSVLITSSTMLPSAHRMLLPGFTSCASFL